MGDGKITMGLKTIVSQKTFGFATKISYIQEEITHMQQVFLYVEINLLKNCNAFLH